MSDKRDACPTCGSTDIGGFSRTLARFEADFICRDPWHNKRDEAGTTHDAADEALVDEKSYSTNLPESLEKAIDECHAVACNNWEDESKHGRCEYLRERLWHISQDEINKERDEKIFNFNGWVKAEDRCEMTEQRAKQLSHASSEPRDALRERVEMGMSHVAAQEEGVEYIRISDAVSVAVRLVEEERTAFEMRAERLTDRIDIEVRGLTRRAEAAEKLAARDHEEVCSTLESAYASECQARDAAEKALAEAELPGDRCPGCGYPDRDRRAERPVIR